MPYKLRLDSYQLYKNGKCLDYGNQSYTDLYYYKYVFKFTLVEGTWAKFGASPDRLKIIGSNLNPGTKVDYIKYRGNGGPGEVNIVSDGDTLPDYLGTVSEFYNGISHPAGTTTPTLNGTEWNNPYGPNNGSNYTFEFGFTSVGLDENISSIRIALGSSGGTSTWEIVQNPTLNYQPTLSVNVLGELTITNLNAMSQSTASYIPASNVTRFKFYGVGINRNVDVLMKASTDTTSSPLPLMTIYTSNYSQSNPFVFLMSRSIALAGALNSISFRTILGKTDNQPATIGNVKYTEIDANTGEIYTIAKSPNIVAGQVLQTPYKTVSDKEITVILTQEELPATALAPIDNDLITEITKAQTSGQVSNIQSRVNNNAYALMPSKQTMQHVDNLDVKADFDGSTQNLLCTAYITAPAIGRSVSAIMGANHKLTLNLDNMSAPGKFTNYFYVVTNSSPSTSTYQMQINRNISIGSAILQYRKPGFSWVTINGSSVTLDNMATYDFQAIFTVSSGSPVQKKIEIANMKRVATGSSTGNQTLALNGIVTNYFSILTISQNL